MRRRGLFSLAALRLGARMSISPFDPRASRARKRCVPRATEPATGASTAPASSTELRCRTRPVRRGLCVGCAPSHGCDVGCDTRRTELVKPGGTLVLAIYNRSTGLISSQRWLCVLNVSTTRADHGFGRLWKQSKSQGGWSSSCGSAEEEPPTRALAIRRGPWDDARDGRPRLARRLAVRIATAEEVVGFLQPLGLVRRGAGNSIPPRMAVTSSCSRRTAAPTSSRLDEHDIMRQNQG